MAWHFNYKSYPKKAKAFQTKTPSWKSEASQLDVYFVWSSVWMDAEAKPENRRDARTYTHMQGQTASLLSLQGWLSTWSLSLKG